MSVISIAQQPGESQLPGIKRLCVIGVGLIGGSFAKAIKEAGVVGEVVGFGRSVEKLERAIAVGAIDRYSLDIAEAVKDVDLVFIAVPILSTVDILRQIAPHLSPGTIITDGGSTKASVVAAAQEALGEIPARLVPGHPIAGSEQHGVAAAKSDLFAGRSVILTPLDNTDTQALDAVDALWCATGAKVIRMSPAHHDEVLAYTSHLPHLLAFSLVDTLAKHNENQEIFKYAAGGFRDFTRIASSDPTMWHDIFRANKQAVLASLDVLQEGLQTLGDAVRDEDSQTILGVLTRAKAARDHFTKMLTNTAYTNENAPGAKQQTFITKPAQGPLQGDIRVPGDKSISHRSIMLGAIAEGVTDITGFLEGEDALATLQAFRDMGVVIEGPDNGEVKVHGVGLRGLKAPPGPLYVGNSGTSMRLLAGLLSGQTFDVELAGDESLTKRPMGRVADPLKLMGADITTQAGKPPIRVSGGRDLKAINYDVPVASAQVKSALLLAGLYAEGETQVIEPAPTRDHTERMLTGFGYPVATKDLGEGRKQACVVGGGSLKGTRVDVPSDISSTAFFMVAASIVPGSEIRLRHVGINPTRIGVINILRLMGGDISVENERVVGGEPVADILVKSAPLIGIDIPEDQVALAIDEFPVIFIAAACADGTTVLSGAEELRFKESDRIQVMADGLSNLGVTADARPDGICIQGGAIQGGEVNSHGDHRIAMAFAVAALRAEDDVTIRDCANVATSFPNFVDLAQSVGMRIEVV